MPTPDRTSRAEIVAAGRSLLESNGPAGITMRAVADRVGVKPPSLYKRIEDRDALLAAIAEAVIADLSTLLHDAEGDLAALAKAYRSFATAHPEGFRLTFTPAAPLESLVQSSAPVIRTCAAIVGDEPALNAARLFTAWATGFLHMELAGAFRLGGDVDAAFEYGLERIIASVTNDG